MPAPKPNEKKEDYLKRCMAYPDHQDLDPKARYAKCNGMWEQAMKLSDALKDIKLANIADLLNEDYISIDNVEILNQYHNAHGLKFSDIDMEQIVLNYKKLKDEGELTPNVKISHSDQQLIMQELFKMHDVEFGEELPNIGILENFRTKATNKGKSIVADIKKIPKVLKNIYGGLYTSLSPEIIPNWRGELGKVVRGIVLSNNPSQKHIPDVYAMSEALRYDGNIILIEGGNHMGAENKNTDDITLSDEQLEKVLTNENVILKFADKMKSALGIKEKETKKKKGGDDEDGIVKLSAEDYQNMQDTMAEVNELKKKLIEKDEKQQNFSDTLEDMKKKTRKETADAICSKAMNDGVPKAFVEKVRPLLMSDLVDQTIKLSHMVDDKMVEADVKLDEVVKGLLNEYPGERVDMSDRTSTDITAPSDDKMKKVRARVKELKSDGMSEHEALTKAGEEIL